MQKSSLSFITVIIILLVLVLLFAMLFSPSPVFEDFSNYKEDFANVATAAKNIYENNDNQYEVIQGHITIDLSDDIWAQQNVQTSAISIENQGLTYLWVSDEYVIFWEDERKVYGVVYSKKALSVISKMQRDWYNGMRYKRLASNWYEIGQFGR